MTGDRPLEQALAWLTLEMYEGRGAVTFCLTEDGDIGLFVGEIESDERVTVMGGGNTAGEALLAAHRTYHAHPTRNGSCDCAERLEAGG